MQDPATRAQEITITKQEGTSPSPRCGEVAERLKAHAWKACLGETLTRVRIPPSPPVFPHCKKGTPSNPRVVSRPIRPSGSTREAFVPGYGLADDAHDSHRGSVPTTRRAHIDDALRGGNRAYLRLNRPIARFPGTISPNDEVDRLTFVSYPQQRVAAVPSIPEERYPEHPMKRRGEVLILAGPRIATITKTLSPVQFQTAIAAGLGNGARQLWSFRESTSDRLFLPTDESRAVRSY